MKPDARIVLDERVLRVLSSGKNLLAFSHGSDSSALFYLLQDLGVEFDMAMIDYNLRASSKAEVAAARALASEFKKQIFITNAPNFKGNFEHEARNFRYAFFEQIMQEKGFDTLILAHQLNDLFEWFLMQLSRGAGLCELLGMKSLEKREFKTHLDFINLANNYETAARTNDNFKTKKHFYTLARPLLHTSKAQILAFLKERDIKFFKDESNEDEAFERNFFRKRFSDEFMGLFAKGVLRSFEYLAKDFDALFDENVREFKGISICDANESVIARVFKQKGVVLSAATRARMMQKDCVIAHQFALCFYQNKALIFEYIKDSQMPKKFKDECRLAQIPAFLRKYLWSKNISINEFETIFKGLI